MESIKPKTVFKNVYIVQNFGSFRDLFYSLKDAKRYVAEEGTDERSGIPFYQIYKGDIIFKVKLYK